MGKGKGLVNVLRRKAKLLPIPDRGGEKEKFGAGSLLASGWANGEKKKERGSGGK